ncbi:unnamed protein product, partial [Staurois parvus]
MSCQSTPFRGHLIGTHQCPSMQPISAHQRSLISAH